MAIDHMGKKEVWGELQKMDEASVFEHCDWVEISDGAHFQWQRWVANIAGARVGHGLRPTWMGRRGPRYFELSFIDVRDPAQPDLSLSFTIMLWKKRRQAPRVQIE